MKTTVAIVPENDKPSPGGFTILSKYGTRFKEERGRAPLDDEEVIRESTHSVCQDFRVVIGISLGEDSPLNGLTTFDGSFIIDYADTGRQLSILGAIEFDWRDVELETSIDAEFEVASSDNSEEWQTFISVSNLSTAINGAQDDEIEKMITEWLNSLNQISVSALFASGVVYAGGSMKPWFTQSLM